MAMLERDFESSLDEYLGILAAIALVTAERHLVKQRLEALSQALRRQGAAPAVPLEYQPDKGL